MRMDEYFAIQSAINSLADSTYLKIVTENFTAVMDGRCSQYVSHRSVEFSQGHGVPGAIILRNTWKFICIVPERGLEEIEGIKLDKAGWTEFSEESDLELKIRELEVPSNMFSRIVKNTEIPIGLPDVGIIKVVMPFPEVEGWDEDHRPVFKKKDGLWHTQGVSGYDVRWQLEGHQEVNLQMKVWGRWEPILEVEYDGYELVIIGEGGKTLYEDEPCTSGLEAVREFLYDDDGLDRFAGVCYSLGLTPVKERENWVVLDKVDHAIHDVDLILTLAVDILVETADGSFHTFARFDSVDGQKVIIPKLGDPIAIPKEYFHEMDQWVMERQQDGQ